MKPIFILAYQPMLTNQRIYQQAMLSYVLFVVSITKVFLKNCLRNGNIFSKAYFLFNFKHILRLWARCLVMHRRLKTPGKVQCDLSGYWSHSDPNSSLRLSQEFDVDENGRGSLPLQKHPETAQKFAEIVQIQPSTSIIYSATTIFKLQQDIERLKDQIQIIKKWRENLLQIVKLLSNVVYSNLIYIRQVLIEITACELSSRTPPQTQMVSSKLNQNYKIVVYYQQIFQQSTQDEDQMQYGDSKHLKETQQSRLPIADHGTVTFNSQQHIQADVQNLSLLRSQLFRSCQSLKQDMEQLRPVQLKMKDVFQRISPIVQKMTENVDFLTDPYKLKYLIDFDLETVRCYVEGLMLNQQLARNSAKLAYYNRHHFLFPNVYNT